MTVTVKEVQKEFRWTNLRNQYFGTFAVDLIMFANGLLIGWLSPATGILTSENTPLITGPLTSEQVSWIGSINCISGLIGSCTIGYIISLIGCKRATIFLSIPVIVFWVLIYFATNFYEIVIARFLGR